MKKDNKIDTNSLEKRKSLAITVVLGILILLLVFAYTWTIERPQPKIVVAILMEDELLPPPPKEPIVPKPISKEVRNSSPSQPKVSSNKTTTAVDKKNSSKYTSPSKIISQTQKKESPVKAQPNSQPQDLGTEENQRTSNVENEALRNMREGRNQGGGSDGTRTTGSQRGGRDQGDGNGTGNGIGTIGEGGRYLIGKVPGTEGDTSPPLSNPCEESGTVSFKYTVSKSGQITAVYRAGGSSDPCLSNTGISWIKQYVKANAGSNSASGVYRIKFR